MPPPDSVLQFPCRFPIKAMGPAEADMRAIVVEIVGRHAPALDPEAVRVRPSRGGRWLAVTVTIEAQSRAQLDAIYQDLTAHASVLWAL